ncbi:hypothetical protein BDM02DRAFT_3093348 [Thelephora ganbajun]|uniref:Uncharacterized protein n=1 Tax=Thelephora ganbajun TaxID=370292 RepID=A0ACB6ZME9_THEGA|nr:hypothetical protein BDM02DRAFT_3093348 [Thelephora ganbajun]
MSPSVLRDVEATRKLLEIIRNTPNGSKTVARLARTCKTFNEPAMDVLWNELDSFLPLIGLFPGYIMKRARRPGLGLAKMPVDADWKDLLLYADRVRKITYEEGAHNVPTSIFPVFEGRCPRQWILPNLAHLVWKCDTPAGLDRGKVFLSAGLQSLTLEVGHKFSNLSDFLAVLSTRTRLTSFSLASLGPLPKDFSRVMVHQGLLEKVSIVAPGALDAKIGKWVSELPELRSLRLDLTGQSMSNVEGFFDEIAPGSGWSTPESEESRDSGVFSELDFTEIKKTTAFSRSGGDARRGACPQLRQLHLTGQAGNIVTFLKQLAGHIHTLELAIEDPPEDLDWQDLCAVICNKLSGSLRSLRILSAAPLKQMEMPRSPGRFQDHTARRLFLSYFSSLPRLAVFEIDLPESVVFDNSDVVHLATICPAIEVLKLCPQARWPTNLAPPSVTLEGIAPLTSGCKRLHTLELALTAKAGSNEILNTRSVSSESLCRLHVGHSHLKDSLQVAILLSHLAPRLDNLKWLNERGPRSNTLNMNADGWHKVCEYLPHLQTIRLSEKRMSAVEIVVPPQVSEKSVDATVLSVDTGVQALVQTTECSVQFSPVLVDQEISAIPGVNEVSVDARPAFSEAGVLVIPTLLEKSIGSTAVGRAVGSLTNVASKSLEAIMETVAPKETPANQTEPAPKVSFPMRVVRAYVYFVTFPIRFLLCSAKPVEDEKVSAEASPSSNATSEKSPVASSSTSHPTGGKTTNDVETSENAVGDEPEPTVHLARAVPIAAF